MIAKFDKVDSHEIKIALLEHGQAEYKIKYSEMQARVKDLEHDAANSHS
jgi:hypothetical protein